MIFPTQQFTLSKPPKPQGDYMQVTAVSSPYVPSRAEIAMHAMHAMIQVNFGDTRENVARSAVMYADALLAELAKPKEQVL